jgi:serine/threonine protein phosphatase PrpC
MLKFHIAILTDPGGRTYNEDACGHRTSTDQLHCILADGAGGHGGGDIASRLAVTYMLNAMSQKALQSASDLSQLFLDVNQALINARVAGTSSANMHTTAVGLVVDARTGKAIWGHCGDSRLYWLRNGQVIERTVDHSYVQSLVNAGLLREDETRGHPQRSQLFSALGSAPEDLTVTVLDTQRCVVPGDSFFLCSDGVWEYINDDLIVDITENAANPDVWRAHLNKLIEDATAEAPNHDNFTAMAVWVSGQADAPTASDP